MTFWAGRGEGVGRKWEGRLGGKLQSLVPDSHSFFPRLAAAARVQRRTERHHRTGSAMFATGSNYIHNKALAKSREESFRCTQAVRLNGSSMVETLSVSLARIAYGLRADL